MALKEGTRLGPYEILSPIGAGGMGEVYRARDTRLDRTVAIKVLPSHLSSDAQRQQRFEREARAASALNHPNILTVFDIGQVDDTHYIATEYVAGQTLRQRMDGATMSLSEVLEVTSQIAGALAVAHAARIVHRDVKPENIMVRPDGLVKVLDFGLAKLTECGEGRSDSEAATGEVFETEVGVVKGTVTYMSPEQARGLKVDPRSDIFSLGVVLYEMIAGRVPFEGQTASDVIVSILTADPAPLARVPSELERIMTKALVKVPEARYQTIHEMALDLRNLKQELETRLKRYEVQGRVQSTSASTLTLERRRHNLPVQLTPLIGRAAEVVAAERLLRREGVRLLTFTGAGGTGKTRLALQVAENLVAEFEDGVHFVSLASISDAGLVASTIAQTVGIKETGGIAVGEGLKDHLRDKQMLLVLDNFEQVISAATLVPELLTGCPRLKVLVTSRAVLHLSGEHELPVPPLALPDPKHLPLVEALMEYESVALFIARAVAVKPDFALNSENAWAVSEICSRLDGLPLAIELAAARIKLLPPQAMLARLESRLKLLTDGARDLPARQQTMRRTISWSYDLLDTEERTLLRWLSVFVGGCTLDASEAVCQAAGDLERDVLGVMASLVDKSLLQQKEGPGGEPRFTMLETIREYAHEHLVESGEATAVEQHHLRFFLEMAERAEAELLEANQGAWLDRLELEHENIRVALERSLESGQVETALRLGAAFWHFWEMRGSLTEGLERLRKLIEASAKSKASKAREKVLYAAGILADAGGHYEQARGLFQENLVLHRASGNQWGVANSLNNLGIVALRQQDYRAARALYQESLGLWRELGNPWAAALSLNNLGNVANLEEEHDEARRLHEESLAIFHELGDHRGVAWSLNHLGDVARDQGDHEAARARYEESLARFREIGLLSGVARALADLGNLSCDRGDLVTARAKYEEALAIFGELGDARGIARLLEAFMVLATVRGERERAARLAGAALRIRETLGARLPPAEQSRFDRNLHSLRAELGELNFQKLWSESRRLSIVQAIEYALALQG